MRFLFFHVLMLAMSTSKVYTRTGDQGETSLIGGERVSKSHLRLEAAGAIDELNSCVGWLVSEIMRSSLALQTTDILKELEKIQISLFDLGSHVACSDVEILKQLPQIKNEEVTALEESMDRMSLGLSPLKNFILPGGHVTASCAHMARTIARRAERSCIRVGDLEPLLIRYMNRSSDYFFVLARHLNSLAQQPEVVWKPR